MKSFRPLRGLFVSWLACAVLVLHAANQPPNIIIMLTDDQGYGEQVPLAGWHLAAPGDGICSLPSSVCQIPDHC